MRVLVVEDFEILARTHRHRAAPRGHGRRRRPATATTRWSSLAVTRYDVVVLDRDLPGVHGDEVCRRIVAAHSASRVLMLTAASTVRQRVDGLGLGADDYLPKPFDFAELVARIRALGRRCATALPPILDSGDLTLDPSRRVAVPGRAAARAQPEGVRRPGVPARRRRPAGLGRGTARTGLGRGRRPVHHRGEDDDPPAAGQARRPAGHPHRPRGRLPDRGTVRPRRTLRTRLTLLYAGPFFLSATVLLVIPILRTNQTEPASGPVILGPGGQAGPGDATAHRVLAASAIGLVRADRGVAAARLARSPAGSCARCAPSPRPPGTSPPATCTAASAGPAAATSSPSWPRPSTTCSSGWRRPFAVAAALRRQRLARTAHPAHRGADPAAGGPRRPGRHRATRCASACQEVLALGRGAGTAHRRAADPGQRRAGRRAAGAVRPRPPSPAPSCWPAPRRPGTAASRSRPRSPPPRPPATRSLVESLVANLVDNALRHNLPGGRVEITTSTAAGQARVDGAEHRGGDPAGPGRAALPALPAARPASASGTPTATGSGWPSSAPSPAPTAPRSTPAPAPTAAWTST